MSSENYFFQGGKAAATVRGNHPDTAELSQIYAMLRCPALEGASIQIMPDHHAGKGCVVGFTAKGYPNLIPNLIGVDIGCGILALNLGPRKMQENEFKNFDRYLRDQVPSGFNNREEVYKELKLVYSRHVNSRIPWDTFSQQVDEITKKANANSGTVWKSVGSLGSGNHFLELNLDHNSEDLYLTIHSGSRNFGLKVCLYHQKKAIAKVGPKQGLEWLEGADAEEYLRDMRVAQQFAMLNRAVMMTVLAKHFDVKMRDAEVISAIHNFIGDDNIIRKGAISAKKGEQLIIPLNMKNGSLLAVGKGNPDWNNSAPHGAGRLMSRGGAKQTLTLTDYKADMEGIWSSCISRDTIDEAPKAYKDPLEIEAAIGDTVEITNRLIPIYNFKASKEEKAQ